jgi:hypothetical protein
MYRRAAFFLLPALLVLPVPVLADHALPSAVKLDGKVSVLCDKALKDNVAWKIVESVTTEIGPRPDGSEAEARARNWAVAKMNELGLQNVHIEKYKISAWPRKAPVRLLLSPSARITAGHHIRGTQSLSQI